MIWFQYGLSIIFLILLGAVAAKAGGSTIPKAVLRVTIWGTIAMAATAAIGYLFGT
jgi:VIT1/CCC1 family predicted Fe2+/Mn2+ transporter